MQLKRKMNFDFELESHEKELISYLVEFNENYITRNPENYFKIGNPEKPPALLIAGAFPRNLVIPSLNPLKN